MHVPRLGNFRLVSVFKPHLLFAHVAHGPQKPMKYQVKETSCIPQHQDCLPRALQAKVCVVQIKKCDMIYIISILCIYVWMDVHGAEQVYLEGLDAHISLICGSKRML